MHFPEEGPSRHVIPLLVRRDRDLSSDARPGVTGSDEVPVHVDLLRGDLYQLLDELARAHPDRQRTLAREFERAWERFKDTIALSA